MGPAGPLAGIRVLDASTVVMGPWATHFLAAFGADVVKLEAPGGDIIRTAGPMRNPKMGSVFLTGARGKRSIVLDLKTAGGRDAFLRVLARTDAFVHNMRAPALQRLGLDDATLRTHNAKLVILAMSGYGRGGPERDRPAYDDLIQGASGLAWAFERSGGEPRYVPALVADRYVGACACAALLAALLGRERTGIGTSIALPMYETMVEMVLADHLGGETFVPAHGEPGYARVLVANRRPYATADGFLGVLLYDPRDWERFFELAGHGERYRSEPRLHDHDRRARDYDFAYGEVAAIMRERTTADWLVALRAADIATTAINGVTDLLRDPQLCESGFFGEEAHPSEGTLRTMAPTVSFEAFATPTLGPAPRLGEHTVAVLREAGFADAAIDALLASGAAHVAAGRTTS